MLNLKDLPHPGMRAVKTGLAVAVVITIYHYLFPDNWTQGAMLASMAAIVCMQASVEKSISSGVSRLIGTFIGSLLACLISMLHLENIHFFLWVGVNVSALVLLIYIFNLLRQTGSVVIGCMVFVMIIIGISGDPFVYSGMRLLDTVVGLVVSTLINRFIFAPKAPAES